MVLGHVENLPKLKSFLTLYQTTKLKAFVDNNFNVAHMVQFYFRRVENIVGKGENAGYQHFLLFPRCFQKVSFSLFSWSLKLVIVW